MWLTQGVKAVGSKGLGQGASTYGSMGHRDSRELELEKLSELSAISLSKMPLGSNKKLESPTKKRMQMVSSAFFRKSRSFFPNRKTFTILQTLQSLGSMQSVQGPNRGRFSSGSRDVLAVQNT